MLPAGLVVLEADAFRRVRVQVEALLGAARDQFPEVVPREPLAAIACRLHLGLVTVVPDEVDGVRLGVEALGVLVLDAIAIRELHVFYLSFADVLAFRIAAVELDAREHCIPLVFFENDFAVSSRPAQRRAGTREKPRERGRGLKFLGCRPDSASIQKICCWRGC